MNQPNGKNTSSPATLDHESPESVVSLNRLMIAGGIVGIGLLVVLLVIFTGGGTDAQPESQNRTASNTAQGPDDPQGRTFMNQDPPEEPEEDQPPEEQPPSSLGSSYQPPPGTSPPPSYQAYNAPPPAGRQAGPSPEEQLYQQALTSDEMLVLSSSRDGSRQGMRAQGSGVAQMPPSGSAGSREGSALDEQVERRMQQYSRQYGTAGASTGAMNLPPGATPPQARPQQTQSQQGGQNLTPAPGSESAGFQRRVAAQSQGDAYYQANVTPPRSEYEIKAGSVIPAVLMTAINSELPGSVVAQVSRPVFDSATQQHVLIPKGAKLIGSYDDQIALGQSRAMVAWSRIIFPDGRSIQLPGLDSKDLSGATGMDDQVNRHYARIFGSAIALSAVGAGFQLSQPNSSGGGFGYQRDPQQVVAAELGRELSRVATEMIRRNMDIQPTLKIREGFRFYVFFNKDLALPAPYTPASTGVTFERFTPRDEQRIRREIRQRVPATLPSKMTTTEEKSGE